MFSRGAMRLAQLAVPLAASTTSGMAIRSLGTRHLLDKTDTTSAAVSRRLLGSCVVSWVGLATMRPRVCGATETTTTRFGPSELSTLERGLASLEDLVANWQTRTLNCAYVAVDNRLLASANKAQLLEEARTNALMQKKDTDDDYKLCRRDPETVRLALGLDSRLNSKSGVPAAFATKGLYRSLDQASTGSSDLVGADRLIRRGLEAAPADRFDDYLQAEEDWLAAISALDSASYMSKTADFASIVTVRADDDTAGEAKFLDQARREALNARDALRTIVDILASALDLQDARLLR